MANLKVEEFNQIIHFLAEAHGLQAFRDKLVRLNALVTRRKAASAARLATQLYTLTGGLRREVPATIAVHSLWAEQINKNLGEDGEKRLGEIAEKINDCLDDDDRIIEERSVEISEHIRDYEKCLAIAAGAGPARVDMILKAVPDVAERLRTMPLVEITAKEKSPGDMPGPGVGADGENSSVPEDSES